MANYKKRCEELDKTIKQLREELNSLKTEGVNSAKKERDIMHKAFHSTSQIMAISNLESGVYEDVNEAFLQSLGYTREEIIGKTSQEIELFADIVQSDKFIKIVTKFNKVQDVEVALRTKSGNEKKYLFSADTIFLCNLPYLLTYYNEIRDVSDETERRKSDSVIREVFDTISNYIALFLPVNNRFLINDFNFKASEIEFIDKKNLIGEYVDETPLAKRSRLLEILHHVNITREPYKLAVSPAGDDSEGYYTAFLLSSSEIVVTWEPGKVSKNKEKAYIKQGLVFERFGDTLPVVVFEIDLKGRVVYANEQGLDFFGYEYKDLGNGIMLNELFREQTTKVLSSIQKLRSPKQTTHNEYIAYHKDGTGMPILTHTFAVFDGDTIVGYRGLVVDNSDKKSYEDQIRKEKAFLERLIDSAPEAIAICSNEGKLLRINRRFTELFGYEPKEIIDKILNKIIVPEALFAEAMEFDERAKKTTIRIKNTARIGKSGNTIQVDLIVSKVTVNNEDVATIGIYRDITAARKTQLQREVIYNISSFALRTTDTEKLYRMITEEVGKIWDTNNFFIALFNKDSNTLSLPVFSDEKDSFTEVPARKTLTKWVIDKEENLLVRKSEILDLEKRGEIELIGTVSEIWMGVPMKTEDGVIGVIVLQDYNDPNKFTYEDLNALQFISNQVAAVVQRQTLLDSLVEARKTAEEAAQSKQQFMSTMSHEIRTPLNEVIGITNLLLQAGPREDQKDFLKTLRFSGNHLLTLVNDVLDYNKIASGNIVLEKTQFNHSQFLDEINRSYTFRTKEKELLFILEKDPALPDEIIGDQVRLNQILSNLLSNAVKFTNEGEIKLIVQLTNTRDNLITIRYTIKDTGIGINRDALKKIFESYAQASDDTTRKFGGTGLGLAISKRLVEIMEGEITVESEPDKGSEFSFEITYSKGKEGVISSTELPEESLEELRGIRVLVAEDNKVNFFVANQFLQGWGTLVTHAENGLIALEVLEKEEFDIILMDLHMPVMDGIEATEKIRASENPSIQKLPIIALTAGIMSENQVKMEELDINDYVLKPFKPLELYKKIVKLTTGKY